MDVMTGRLEGLRAVSPMTVAQAISQTRTLELRERVPWSGGKGVLLTLSPRVSGSLFQ